MCYEEKAKLQSVTNGVLFLDKRDNEARRITGKNIVALETIRITGDPSILVGSSEKALKILKWQPAHNSLTEIIETAWQWHQKSRGF
jgi:UDP-glucose 4-epimerase